MTLRNRKTPIRCGLLFTTVSSAFIVAGCIGGGDGSNGDNGGSTGQLDPNNLTFTALGPMTENDPDAPDRLTVVDDRLHFVAEGLEDGVKEVYTTDGTADGTEPVTEFTTDIFGSRPHQLTVWNGELFLAAENVPGMPSGEEYLVALDDGESGGVRSIANLFPLDGVDGQQAEVAVAGDTLFVNHETYDHGRELHATDDGNPGSLSLVKNINETPAEGAADFEGSDPEDLIAVGDVLFFTADDGNGRTLWVTDGTEPGTKKLIDGTPDISRMTTLEGFDDRLFVRVDDDPWVSDGTKAGTEQLDPASDHAGRFARLDDSTVLFGAANRLWMTDGTPAGTEEVTDSPDAIDSESAVLDGDLYFRRNDREVWTSDGTSDGTQLVLDMGEPGEWGDSGRPDYFTAYGGIVFFTADPIGEDGATGVADDTQLWVTDGTAAGTTAVEPPDATIDDPVSDTWHDAFQLKVHDGALYLSAEYTVDGRQLWRVDYD